MIASKYYFDDDAADRAERFFPDLLVHVKGPLAKTSEPFNLEPWQAEIVRSVFGWKNTADGSRKFRTVYCEVPRKNGKTTFAAGLLLYMLFCDDEPGAEVYSAASTRDQAAIVYQIATSMIAKNPQLSKRCTVRKSVKRVNLGDSFYQSCSSDAGAPHGTSPHCLIFDEVHLQKTRDLWEAFQTGLGARDQPLIFAITTAGHDRSTICWELHKYAKAVESGTVDDPTFLPVLFGADPLDDWTDEKTWEKANPSLDVSLKRDYIRQQCEQAKETPAFENTFRRLHLNQWTSQAARIIPMIKWDECKSDYTAEDMYGETCYGGLDLASTRDVTAFSLVFPSDGDGCRVLCWFWIPEENVDSRAASDQTMIRNYAAQGAVELTDGNEVDIPFLVDRISEICQQYDVNRVGFDPWNAVPVVQLLRNQGMPDIFEKMPQTFATYNQPFKQLLGWLGNGKLEHDGNAVLRWMAENVSHKEDPAGNIRPDKGKSAEKIDGVCAMLMAMGLAAVYGSDGPGAYATSGDGVVLW